MPSTYNGIGTHYYGKKNIHKRAAACPHCGRQVELTSYDTRLWFVILFIPVFPCGRKRIIDYCPACTRHYAMEADKWETAKQLELSGAQEKFRASQSPEDAMALHQQFLNFHQFDQAAEFRKTMREKFADNAKVHAYLGAALEHFGNHDEAAGCYARALELRSDLPEARIGVARAHIRAGKLDDARKLLDFLEKPGASQLYSLEPLDTLARAYQGANRHDDALALFALIQKELPKVAEEKWFRALVAKSEKAANRSESQLPKQKFSLKRLFSAPSGAAGQQPQLTWRSLLGIGIVLALFVLGFAVANEYIRRHRTLHIVSDYKQPATIRITGGPVLNGVLGVREVVLSEGRHHASITGPVTEELDFEIRAGYFSRWFDDPAWILNVGGKAILIETEAVYSRDPRPPRIAVHFGKEFELIPRVTHPFRELPPSLRMKESETRTLVSLELHRGEGTDVFAYYLEQRNGSAALDFAEKWLEFNPADEQMLRIYAASAAQSHATNRLDTFLRAGLAVRPVRIEWHREYQGLHNNPAGHAAMVADYQAQLRAEPTNSALLYLCGRLEPDRAKCRDYFERAAAADPSNAYPPYALGYDRMAAGEWAAARSLFTRAVQLRPADQGFKHWLTLTRFATGDDAALEQEARAAITRDGADLAATTRLIDVLALQNRRADADTAWRAFQGKAPAKYREQATELSMHLRCHLLYEFGEFAELEKVAATAMKDARAFRVQAMMEQGRVADALKMMGKTDEEDDKPLFDLAVALAFQQAGDAAQADHWMELARQALAQGNEDQVRAAELLGRRAGQISMAELKDAALMPQFKAAWLAAIYAAQPQGRADVAAFARSLNVERTFPHHLIQRVTEPRP